LKELENLGIDWHSYTEQYISSVGPWRDVVISIFATIAKLEAKRISDRTKAKLEFIKEEIKKNKQYRTQNNKIITGLGRPSLPDEVVKQIENYLCEGLNYPKISELATYKAKYGVLKHVSVSQICQINKQFRKRV